MVIWAAYTVARHWGRAMRTRTGSLMDILLHLGAHRCATTHFQAYLDQNSIPLGFGGVGLVTPRQTRSGLMQGLLGPGDTDARHVQRGLGRLALHLAQAQRSGARQLLISEENILGAMRQNLRVDRLYPMARHGLARLRPSLSHPIRRIGLAIRSYDSYWASAISTSVLMGHKMPGPDKCDRLVTQPRRWRDVIQDIAREIPKAEIVVWRFEDFAAWPERQLEAVCGRMPLAAGLQVQGVALNTAPNRNRLRLALSDRGEDYGAIRPGIGRWMPFDAAQRTAMQAQYQDDLTWLACGADGAATYINATAHQALHTTMEVTGARSDASPPNAGGHHGIQRHMG